jgi:hypothetical protein
LDARSAGSASARRSCLCASCASPRESAASREAFQRSCHAIAAHSSASDFPDPVGDSNNAFVPVSSAFKTRLAMPICEAYGLNGKCTS